MRSIAPSCARSLAARGRKMVAGVPCDDAPSKILCSGYLRAVTPARRRTPRPRTPAEDEFAEVAATAARATFAVFHDDPTSALYCAAGMTPEETWRAVTEQVAVVAADAAVEAIRGYNAASKDISRWHRLIFEAWFPEQAGWVRRGDEQGQYGVVWGAGVVDGGQLQGTQCPSSPQTSVRWTAARHRGAGRRPPRRPPTKAARGHPSGRGVLRQAAVHPSVLRWQRTHGVCGASVRPHPTRCDRRRFARPR